MQSRTSLLAALALASVAAVVPGAPAQAHYLWSENTPKGNVVYYGGVDENVRERSPGRLDAFEHLQLQLQVQQWRGGVVELTPRTVTRSADGFAAGERIARHASLVGQDLSMAVQDLSAYQLGLLKLDFYLRHQYLDQVFPAVLDLDAVATGVPGQVRVSFRGQPLAGVKAKLAAPNGWVTELQADGAGRLQLRTPWRGNYVLEVSWFENTSGEFQGQHFERIRHRLALTLVQPRGPATFVPDYRQPVHAD